MTDILSAQTTHTSQFEELYSSINSMSSNIIHLKTENTALRTKISTLKATIEVNKWKLFSPVPGNLVIQILRGSFEHCLCDQNAFFFVVT